MSTLHYEFITDEPHGSRVDAVLGSTAFEVLVRPRDFRLVRASVSRMAQLAAGTRWERGILILDSPGISRARLHDELQSMRALFRPEIEEKLTFVICREAPPHEVIGMLSDEHRESIEAMLDHFRTQATRPRRQSEAFFEIMRVLLVHWFRRSGPITSKDICVETGSSYPTVADALERLEPWLFRHSDRRVELRSFPKDEWLKLVAQAGKVRASIGYADRSGRPRSPESLLNRLRDLGRDDIAVGGVLGARLYLPGLDIIGTPRLDLVLHRNTSNEMTDPLVWIRRLDPALKPAERGEPCQVVVHTLLRPESFFSELQDRLHYADEVECLLDLHESRMEQQALEFLDSLSPKPKQ